MNIVFTFQLLMYTKVATNMINTQNTKLNYNEKNAYVRLIKYTMIVIVIVIFINIIVTIITKIN